MCGLLHRHTCGCSSVCFDFDYRIHVLTHSYKHNGKLISCQCVFLLRILFHLFPLCCLSLLRPAILAFLTLIFFLKCVFFVFCSILSSSIRLVLVICVCLLSASFALQLKISANLMHEQKLKVKVDGKTDTHTW